MSYNWNQSTLEQILKAYHTHKEQLTESECDIASRIVECSLCSAKWVRRKKGIPTRCPKCHKRAWNRPLLEAIRLRNVNQHGPAPREKEE
jgi:hypothetical protein